MNKKLLSKNVYLSPIEISEAEKYTKWLNDEKVATNLVTHFTKNYNIDKEVEAIKLLQSTEQYFSIYFVEGNVHIGGGSLNHVDSINRNCELGIFIGESDYWGKGYGTEAVGLLLFYAFMHLNLNYVGLGVKCENARAIKCYEKNGFRILGRRKNYLLSNNRFTDLILMECTLDDYLSHHQIIPTPSN
ncbi:MAG TPA: GNAT family protein [Anaerolineaceae bacterium]|nr:GNAT family protein [Anaerolineaceae bacterium]HQH87030.1 GNAT family protein [Anaerolineaceae bacterium]